MPETCGDYGGTNRNGDPCGAPAGRGTDFDEGKCKHHRGTSPDGSSHAGNDNATTHGAFKEHFRSDLTDDEQAAVDSLVATLRDIEGPREVPAEVAAEALMKYKRSADDRFLREARQWMSEFNLLPNADEINVGGDASGILIDMNGTDE